MFAHFSLPVFFWQRSIGLRGIWDFKQPWDPHIHNLASGSAFCAVSILEVLKWITFSTTTEDSIPSEGKAGVLRFDGDPARLSEYSFRVRLWQARELSMAEDAVKKLGPLALRLVDGLRGATLQVARTLPVDELANKEKGVEFLLKSMTSSLAPRNKQETRKQRSVPSRGTVWRHLQQTAWRFDRQLRFEETILVQDDDRRGPGLEVARWNLGGAIADELLIRAAMRKFVKSWWPSTAGITRRRRAAVLVRATSPHLSRALEKEVIPRRGNGAPTTWRTTTNRSQGRAHHNPLAVMRTSPTTTLCTVPGLQNSVRMSMTPSTLLTKR